MNLVLFNKICKLSNTKKKLNNEHHQNQYFSIILQSFRYQFIQFIISSRPLIQKIQKIKELKTQQLTHIVALMTQNMTLYQAHLQNIRQIEFQKDIQALKQAQQIRSMAVKQQCEQINELYQKKAQDLNTLKKIKQSFFINEMRMRIAKTKYQYAFALYNFSLCEQIFSEVLRKLGEISQKNDKDYQLILIRFIVEGCIQMFEENIKIKVLQKDLNTVKMLLPDIIKSFQYFMSQEMGQQFPLNLIVLENDTLKERTQFQKDLNKNEQSQMGVGGVVLTDFTGNIVFKNTLDARLNILKEIAFPMIREILWENKDKEDERIN